MPDIDLFPVVVNGNNQAIFVPSDIKDGEFLDLVCGGECDPQFCKRGVIGYPYDGIPLVQLNPCIGVFLSKLGQPLSCNDMQTKR
jgi:hypothetical protein